MIGRARKQPIVLAVARFLHVSLPLVECRSLHMWTWRELVFYQSNQLYKLVLRVETLPEVCVEKPETMGKCL